MYLNVFLGFSEFLCVHNVKQVDEAMPMSLSVSESDTVTGPKNP